MVLGDDGVRLSVWFHPVVDEVIPICPKKVPTSLINPTNHDMEISSYLYCHDGYHYGKLYT